jgi:hypothetical protein
MSDGNSFILGQENNADSSTRLRRISHDDVAAPRPAGERRPVDLAPASAADQVALYVENAGDSLLAISFFGTAMEGQNSGNSGGIGVLGTSRIGPGVLGRSSNGPGVRGTSEGKIDPPSTFASDSFGVDGVGRNGATGVRGMTTGINPGTSMGGIAVHGIDVERRGFAGFFEGQVRIQGTLSTNGSVFVNTLIAGTIEAQSKTFRIDHPLDPANKYLIHTVVESPDMKNFYDGSVTLDDQGEATVELPDWFEALNKDFRYQLTPIGVSEPNLYIANEVSNNRFKIGGGASGTKVCWQVTGIRKDVWAESHRNPVEQEKPLEERGLYLNPELYGVSEDLVIGSEHKQSRQQMEELNRWLETDSADACGKLGR